MIRIPAPPTFRLAAAAAFYGGFRPMAGAATATGATVSLAFGTDDGSVPVGVHLTQAGDTVTAEVEGTDAPEAVVPQLRRMLGLDADADAWAALGAREPVVGALQAEFPGFFTAAFPSPWEAGLGGIVTQGIPLARAAALRRRLAEALGTPRAGLWALPGPEVVLRAEAPAGFPPAKWTRLQALARRAADGLLGAERLRALPQELAVAELLAVPGIGPWTAEHVVLRGAAPPDGVPTAEPRVLRALAARYGTGPLDAAGARARMEAWRPFRMWVSILAVRSLAAAGGWSDPGDRGRRGRR